MSQPDGPGEGAAGDRSGGFGPAPRAKAPTQKEVITGTEGTILGPDWEELAVAKFKSLGTSRQSCRPYGRDCL